MNNDDKWINVDKRSNKLVIRFNVKGYSKQFFLSTQLADTAQNRDVVRVRRNLILTDISLERFDDTLASYQFVANRANPINIIVSTTKQNLNLAQLWQRFTEFKKAILEPTTILSNYATTARYITKLPTLELNKAPQIRDWLLQNTSHYMAWEYINKFSDCCEWGLNSGLITQNPFIKLKIKKPRKNSLDNEYLAYTLGQRDLIIAAFEGHRVHSHYANLIKFLFFTGSRLGEAFALTWQDIQESGTRIHINKSCNLHHISKGTKNGKRRIFPVQQGSKLQHLLLDMKPPVNAYAPRNLIFRSKTGCPLNSNIMQNIWNGVTGRYKHKKLFYPGVVRELATKGDLPYLKPYATRHTFATWAIASGITPDRVALWVGDEISTVLRCYCHPNVVKAECPDF
jgi:integrase